MDSIVNMVDLLTTPTTAILLQGIGIGVALMLIGLIVGTLAAWLFKK